MKILTRAALAASIAMASGGAMANHPDATYVAELNSLNNSGVTGRAVVAIDGDILTVVIRATGAEPDVSHAQHIHGKDDGSNATCPTIGADANGDNVVDLTEGAAAYGGVLLNLTEAPTADADGNIVYAATFTLGDGVIATPDLLPLENRHIVIHGTAGNGMYDALLPAACGQLVEQ